MKLSTHIYACTCISVHVFMYMYTSVHTCMCVHVVCMTAPVIHSVKPYPNRMCMGSVCARVHIC